MSPDWKKKAASSTGESRGRFLVSSTQELKQLMHLSWTILVDLLCVQQGHFHIYKFQNLWLELPITVRQHTTSHAMCLQCWSCSQGQVILGGQKVLSQKIKTGEQEAIYKMGETVFSAVVVEVEEDCNVESVATLEWVILSIYQICSVWLSHFRRLVIKRGLFGRKSTDIRLSVSQYGEALVMRLWQHTYCGIFNEYKSHTDKSVFNRTRTLEYV